MGAALIRGQINEDVSWFIVKIKPMPIIKYCYCEMPWNLMASGSWCIYFLYMHIANQCLCYKNYNNYMELQLIGGANDMLLAFARSYFLCLIVRG